MENIRNLFTFLLTKYMESFYILPIKKQIYKNSRWKFKGVSFECSLTAEDLA